MRFSKKSVNSVSSDPLLTPKELAEAIGVSESSLRRWFDRAGLPVSRTAGGHRRIPLAAAIQFIRETNATVVRPELLGFDRLPPSRRGSATALSESATSTTKSRRTRVDKAPAPDKLVAGGGGSGGRDDEPDTDALFRALASGDADVARGLIRSAYLRGGSLAALFDGPVRGALRRLGDLWNHDPRGILVEHRGTGIAVAAVARLRELLPPPDLRAPLAIGGAPEGDPYQIPTLMASLTCAEAGFRDVNFGPNTPIALLGDEAVDGGASLVWLSFSAASDPLRCRGAVEGLAAKLRPRRIELVVGGAHTDDLVPRHLPDVTRVASMSELAAFVRGLRAHSPAVRRR